MKYEYLTFDCYGTLIDWRNGLESNLGGLLQAKGLDRGVSVYPVYLKFEAEHEESYKSYRDVLCDTALAVANHLNISVSESEAREFADTLPKWKPFADSAESLRLLGKRGYKRVILSNIDRDLLGKTIEQSGLEVDGYVTAQDVGSYKPSPGHWNRFFQQHPAAKGFTLHVAQSLYYDIVPSSRMGIPNAWVNRYADERPTGVNPTFTVPNLKSLLNLIE
jgi:2-haloalkanoic acid dehalogenase type II